MCIGTIDFALLNVSNCEVHLGRFETVLLMEYKPVRWAGNKGPTTKMNNSYKVLAGKLAGEGHLKF